MKLDVSRLPQWQCHKIVRGAQIVAIHEKLNGDIFLELADGQRAEVTIGFMERHGPRVGSYLVAYDDGYLSVSPRLPFEEGYTRIEPAPAARDDLPDSPSCFIPPLIEGE